MLAVAANGTNMSPSTATTQSSFECLLSQAFDYYNITDNLPDSVEPTWIFVAVINGIASPPTTVINFLIIWTILHDKNLRDVPHNILITALAVTDFFGGLITEPFYVWYLVGLLKRRPMRCHFTIFGIPSLALSCWTLNTLTVASVDLFIAVEHPQFYIEHISTKTIVIVTAIAWVVNLFGTLGGSAIIDMYSLDRLRKLPPAFMITINILIISYCTLKVQLTAYEQKRAIQVQVESLQQENTDEVTRRRHYKHAVTMAVIVIATLVFYCPYIVTAIIQLTKGKDVTDDFQYISFAISGTFIHLQSLVNPIFISLRLSYIREGIKNILLCRH